MTIKARSQLPHSDLSKLHATPTPTPTPTGQSIAMPNPSSSLAPPVASAARGRRRRLLASQNPSFSTPASGASSSSSSSSSSASSNLSFSFPSFSPAPSPFHHRFFLSPLRASAVPFSWEHRPGIPKTPARSKPGLKPPPLPLPPSLFSNRVVAETEYPFATAADDGDRLIVAGHNTKTRRRRTRHHQQQQQHSRWPALTEWLAVLSPYRSCTRSHDFLAAAAGPPPRPRPRAPA